MKISTEYW